MALSLMESSTNSALYRQKESGQISRDEYHEKRDRMKAFVNETKEKNKEW